MERMTITNAGAVDLDGLGEYFAVVAQTASGYCYTLCHSFEDEASAKSVAAKVEAAGSIDLARWVFWRTVYGSAAFAIEEGDAAMYADGIRAGASEDDPSIPANIRTLL